MLHAITLAITCFTCFAFEHPMKQFIPLVPEEFSLAGNPAEQSVARQLLPRAELIHEQPERMVEEAMPGAGSLILIDLCGL
jgi:hypothetical protein